MLRCCCRAIDWPPKCTFCVLEIREIPKEIRKCMTLLFMSMLCVGAPVAELLH